eukprot:g12634.t1
MGGDADCNPTSPGSLRCVARQTKARTKRYLRRGGAIQNEMHAAAGATPNPLTENESVTAVGGNPGTHAEGNEQSRALELTGVAPSSSRRRRRNDTSVHVQVKFCTHVGMEGVIVLLSLLVIAGLLGYITYLYTARFNKFQRDSVWIFVVLVLIYFLAVLWFLKNWRRIAQDFTERAVTGKEEQARNALAEMYAKTFILIPFNFNFNFLMIPHDISHRGACFKLLYNLFNNFKPFR